MKLKIVVFLFWWSQVDTHVVNPNNYIELDIESIEEELERRIGGSYYDVLILKVHINVNAKYVETSIDDEIERLINNEADKNCRQMLNNFKKKLLRNCQMENNFELLSLTRAKFSKLKEVACLTMEICEDLNPLKTQAIGLEKCALSKIADLRLQTSTVNEEFKILKRELFEDHDKCIRELMSEAYGNIARILFDTCRKL